MQELFPNTIVASWKQIINRLNAQFAPLSDEELQRKVAPGKNRIFYLLGHLTAYHDRTLPLLGVCDPLHPELGDVYLTNPDRALPDPLTGKDLKNAWSQVNSAMTSAVERFTIADWLKKHSAISDDDFAKTPTRNRLAVILNRTNHASFHSGQITLVK